MCTVCMCVYMCACVCKLCVFVCVNACAYVNTSAVQSNVASGQQRNGCFSCLVQQRLLRQFPLQQILMLPRHQPLTHSLLTVLLHVHATPVPPPAKAPTMQKRVTNPRKKLFRTRGVANQTLVVCLRVLQVLEWVEMNTSMSSVSAAAHAACLLLICCASAAAAGHGRGDDGSRVAMCRMLQYVAVCCSVLQCVVVRPCMLHEHCKCDSTTNSAAECGFWWGLTRQHSFQNRCEL